MRHCAFLTMDNLEEFVVYDHLLYEPLRQRGWEVTEVPWRDPDPRWERFEAVVIRTPWDYQDDPGAFMEVLREIDASPARLENRLELVEWNISKRYLRDMERRGVPTVPTLWPCAGDRDLPAEADAGAWRAWIRGWAQELDTDELILKPLVSANADHTYRVRVSADPVVELPDGLRKSFAGLPFLVQPFVKNIISEGEYSLFYFGESYSHTILKTPKSGDFRVQEEHGGRLKLVQEPETALREAAERAMEFIRPQPLYSRIDFVRMEDGRFALMELELIEPSLYFNMDPASPERFAEVFAAWMD
ncbi:MAG: hypothetical protein U5K31_11590 [Balneolaceae bacterium]|nr:hypothetical protein [Balneolaceae bacterium]